MLDDYKDGQPVVYKLLRKIINNSNSHAYLFQTNGSVNANDLVLSFTKSLFCPHNYTNCHDCYDCPVCDRINHKNFPELTIIEPDGLWIKKEQLIDLQQTFSRKAIEGNKKIYIIKQAEKLNASAANSILKFLEEPEENIIAILMTDDIHKILPTIISRCQLIVLRPNSLEESLRSYDQVKNITLLKVGIINFRDKDLLKAFLEDDKSTEKLEAVINFIVKYEHVRMNILLDTKNLWHNYFKDKEEIIFAFEMIILFYKDVLNYLTLKKTDIFDYYIDKIEEVAKLNNIDTINKKLQKILILKEHIKNNINVNLLIDKLIISLEGGVTI